MSQTMIPITPELERVARLHEQLIANFLKARDNTTLGTYEVHHESHAMIALVIRDVEAVCTLAREDLVLFPPAVVIARSAFELAVRALWMLSPDDVWEQEARWLRHARHSEIEFYARVRNFQIQVGERPSRFSDRRRVAKEFYNAVAEKLDSMFPGKYDMESRPPNFRQMLKSLGQEDLYALYMDSSQFTHGSMVATQVYHRHFGTKKVMGELISPNDWYMCLQLCWMSLTRAGRMFLKRVEGDPGEFTPQELIEHARHAFANIWPL